MFVRIASAIAVAGASVAIGGASLVHARPDASDRPWSFYGAASADLCPTPRRECG